MPNILASIETGKNSLISNQIGMDTTGHNISNVYTDGYSRQRVELGTMYPDDLQPGQIGKGVRVERVFRIFNQFLEGTIMKERTGLAEWSAVYDSLSLVEVIFSEPSEFGLNNRTIEFFNSWQNLSEYPEDYGLRSLVRDSGQDFSDTHNQLRLDLARTREETDLKITNLVNIINDVLNDIAELNKRIISIEIAGKDPNDLKDRRDLLINELSEYINIDIKQEDTGIKITFGKYLLVEGNVSNLFGTLQNVENDYMHDVTFGGSVLSFLSLPENTRGELGGQVYFRDAILPSYVSKLTEYSANLAHNVNDEHFSGYSYNGTTTNLNFFTLTEMNNAYADLEVHTSRTGIIRIDDMTDIEVGSHHLILSATGNMVANANGNVSTGGTISLNEAGAFTGTNSGDYYVNIVAPNAGAGDLNGLQVQLVRDGTALSPVFTLGAGAGPTNVVFGTYDGITFDADITATGGFFTAGERSDGYYPDIAASLDGGAAVTVTPNAAYTLTGGSNDVFTAGGTMDIIFGPNVAIGNDTITGYTLDTTLEIESNILVDVNNIASASIPNSAGDNTNTLDIVNLQFQILMKNGTQTFSQFYNELMTSIGSDTKNAIRWKDSQSIIMDQLIEQREAYSGVNLDEELTFMMKFQRGFESASRYVTTIDGMIDVIINRMGYVGR
jgi:flagellar hook-associated protein 1 FlgK